MQTQSLAYRILRILSVIFVTAFFFSSSQLMAADKPEIVRSLLSQTENTGTITLEFTKTKDKAQQGIAYVFNKNKHIQHIIDELNHDFIFPVDIHVVFVDGDGPLYDPESKTIYMSYDFILYLSDLYLNDYPDASNNEMIRFAEESTIFFLYHELAHALIDIYQLPVVSNEETAADNLAVILSLEYTHNGYDIVMDTAMLFDMLDRTTKKYQESDLWDEHALDAQRFYNILCLTYGKDPKKTKQELADYNNKVLMNFIKDKGDYCTMEYERQHQAWMDLLDVHFTQE